MFCALLRRVSVDGGLEVGARQLCPIDVRYDRCPIRHGLRGISAACDGVSHDFRLGHIAGRDSSHASGSGRTSYRSSLRRSAPDQRLRLDEEAAGRNEFFHGEQLDGVRSRSIRSGVGSRGLPAVANRVGVMIANAVAMKRALTSKNDMSVRDLDGQRRDPGVEGEIRNLFLEQTQSVSPDLGRRGHTNQLGVSSLKSEPEKNEPGLGRSSRIRSRGSHPFLGRHRIRLGTSKFLRADRIGPADGTRGRQPRIGGASWPQIPES